MEVQRGPFFKEISLMMFGFGDSHIPNPNTVSLVETITLKQIQIIMKRAMCLNKDTNTNSNAVKMESLIFLMRHNNQKMRRFVQFLQNRQMKALFKSANFNKNPLQNLTNNLDVETKPKCRILLYIETLDETGEYRDMSINDEVKHVRMQRANLISQSLSEEKYLEFCKARAASFTTKAFGNEFGKLRHWIDPNKEIELDKDSLLVLSYLAYQTVAELVDYALLVRLDCKSISNDPVGYLNGLYFTAAMFQPEFELGKKDSKQMEANHVIDFSKVYSRQAPISVYEVKEVMRRIYSPQNGRLNFGQGNINHYLFAL